MFVSCSLIFASVHVQGALTVDEAMVCIAIFSVHWHGIALLTLRPTQTSMGRAGAGASEDVCLRVGRVFAKNEEVGGWSISRLDGIVQCQGTRRWHMCS